jgi:hypothetical protein
VPRYPRHIKFFKRKKRKKRKPSYQVEGFKKASFFEKILPEWVEIFSKTVGLELAFL